MYWRYFMWNFAGRQNDIQGSGEIEHGNWITGIPFIDNFLRGRPEQCCPQDLQGQQGTQRILLPAADCSVSSASSGRLTADQRGIQQFWVVFFLFFMTGIAIVLYLNQTPMPAA